LHFGGAELATEPDVKYAMAFFDGQNLYQHAKDAFGHHHPNYDPIKLHNYVCEQNGWKPNLVRFYTGVPDPIETEMWAGYWSNRVLAMKRAGIVVTTRPIRYRKETVVVDGVSKTVTTPQEKGIDVRLALDIVSFARKKNFDVAVVFSQDQDLQEIVQEVHDISKEQDRWIKVVSAFPYGPSASSKRGIDKTQWVKIGKDEYDKCIDQHDYRPAKFKNSN
jgi:uncharacterized LabA/DUF88 family protein